MKIALFYSIRIRLFKLCFGVTFLTFCDWKVVLFYAKATGQIGHEESPASYVERLNNKPTLADLKSVSMGQVESPSYKLFRRVSIYFSYISIRLRISANSLTALWLLATTVGASLSISFGFGWRHRLLAILLLLIYFIFCIALMERWHVSPIPARTQEAIWSGCFHWISKDELLIVGATIGLYRSNRTGLLTLMLGLACLAMHCVFNYLYVQLETWTRGVELDIACFIGFHPFCSMSCP